MSEPAIKRYAELKGISLFPQKEKYYTIYWLEPERETTLNARDIERNDPILVQVVTATRLQLGIKVHFNGVELVAYPNHQPYALSDGFQKAVKEKGEDKMAFSAP